MTNLFQLFNDLISKTSVDILIKYNRTIWFHKTNIRTYICFLLTLSIFTTQAQVTNKVDKEVIFVNPSVINQDNPEVKKVLETWKKYLLTKDSLYQYNPYWSKAEYKKRNIPDYFFKRINHSVLFDKKNFYKPTILSVENVDSSYVIKTLFASGEKDSGFSRVSGIINVEAIREDNTWRLKSLIDRNLKEKLNSMKTGNITYYYPKGRKLDTALCYQFNSKNNEIAKKFGSSPIQITYYLCADNKEMQRLIGFDFEFSMAFSKQTGGLADIFNNTIYSGNDSEWYLHELIHLYTHQLYGTTINECLNEGLATYIGGSMEKPLLHHIRKTANYVKGHAQNFAKLSTLERIDDETNFQYTISGLLCKIVDEQLGFDGVKKLLESGNSDEDLLNTVEKVIRIKAADFNKFIHQELRKYE